jgi:hypothetical protein
MGTAAVLSLVFAFLVPLIGLILAIVVLASSGSTARDKGLASGGLAVSIVSMVLLAALSVL